MPRTIDDYEIDKKEFDKIKDKALIIDVRDHAEFQLLKKMPNAINVPYQELIANPEKFIATKDKTVITICNAGNRSTIAVQSLREQGYKNAFVLTMGIYGYYR